MPSPLHTPHSSNAPTQSSPESHKLSESASTHPGTSACASLFEDNVKPPVMLDEIVMPFKFKVEPPATSSKVNSAKTPSPAGKDAPVKSKPITIPLSLLNCVSANPDVAPVKVTTDTSNWKPATSKLDE